jgi:hypothetical protein
VRRRERGCWRFSVFTPYGDENPFEATNAYSLRVERGCWSGDNFSGNFDALKITYTLRVRQPDLNSNPGCHPLRQTLSHILQPIIANCTDTAEQQRSIQHGQPREPKHARRFQPGTGEIGIGRRKHFIEIDVGLL